MEAFAIIATLLELALDAIKVTGETGTFTLEIDPHLAHQNLCTIDLQNYRIALWDYDRNGNWEVYSVTEMCPLCPDWDCRYPIGSDFFGGACYIDGVACCSTCYDVYMLTFDVGNKQTQDGKNEIDLDGLTLDKIPDLLDKYQGYSESTQRYLLRTVWKHLYGKARAKSYGVYCGYNASSYASNFAPDFISNFALTGHIDGCPSVWFASYEGMLRACFWLDQQGLSSAKIAAYEEQEAYCDDHAYDRDEDIFWNNGNEDLPPLASGDHVRVIAGTTHEGYEGEVSEVKPNGYYRIVFGGVVFWDYYRDMLELIETPSTCKQLWYALYGHLRFKYYGMSCYGRSFAITGHVNGWQSVWTADRDGLLRATSWLSLQGGAVKGKHRYRRGDSVEIDDEQHRYNGCCGMVTEVNGQMMITVEMTFIRDTVTVAFNQLRPYTPLDWSDLVERSHADRSR